MKRFFKAAALSAAILTGAAATVATAQEIIPDDPQLIIGKLDNGMTYYIRHNSNPEGCADFYIMHNVGALQEEDNQNGLAHFLEHMAFNGTRHYPDKTILNFLAKDGVRFGYNVNAYTSKTETVYNISSVPLVRESFVDSVLMILHDWSCDISCEPQALDDERGVISEEWRRRDDTRTRMALKQNDLVYSGSKYTERSVIGTLEVINGFKPEEILDFYHKWYRPDLQAIAIVGDFDADKMEQKVKKMFSDIPARENPEPKGVYPIPPVTEPMFENMLDPQVKYHVLKIIHRQPFPGPEVRKTDLFYKDFFARQVVSTIMSDRLDAAEKKAGCPVSSAVLVTSPYSADFYVSLFTLSLKKPEYKEDALAFYTREVERMLKYGFTEDEFEAAKFQVIKKYRMNMEDFASDVTNVQIVNSCKEHFLRGFSAANPYDLKETQKIILGNLTYDDVKGYEKQMFGDSEKIYSWCMNESEADSLPSPEEMETVMAEVRAEDIRPEYLSYDKIEFDFDPQPGTVVKTAPVKGTESEIWTLSNGMKVYWTPSEPVKSNTHLVMEIYFNTGYNALPQNMINSAKFAADYYFRSLGFGEYDATAIRNSPECGGTRISAYVGRRFSSLMASSDSKSIETCFKMMYGTLTDPYFSTEAALEKRKQDNLRSLAKKPSNEDLFEEEALDMKYGNHPWMEKLDSADVEAVNMDMMEDVFRRSFNDYDKATVYITSDMDRAEIEALVEKYIASLSNSFDVEMSKVKNPAPIYKGKVVLDKTYDVETVPKAEVCYYFKGRTKLTPENKACMQIMDYIMSSRYLMQIREARGGTYHVSFGTSYSQEDKGAFESLVTFQTRPEMVDILVQDVIDGMEELAADGPAETEMEDAKKYLVKRHAEQEAASKNSLAATNDDIMNFILYGTEYDYDYDAAVDGVSADDIRKFAAKLVKGDQFVTIYREE